ncbi:proline iminopeptidase [Rhizocola hellebori]|uniref:Proline iminopeptidase n=1 Tax=Rhizocola hellebori TaxID=1392758 RepID=A0A8J3VM56_9ACTN|nr:alpha/beta fold hydrolase [Rhizocola hellebori]GIH10873.1 proline iminopeptidase [Rhizocola hellebori]
MTRAGRLIDIGDCELYVSVLGEGFPVLILHGGPGLDHHEFGEYLDPLADRYQLIFVDQRASGRSSRPDSATWTLSRMAADVPALARAMGLPRFAVLGHSYGAFVALQYAVDFPGDTGPVVVSGGLASSRYLENVAVHLATFEPRELREQVAQSWERESTVATPEDFAQLMHDQLPFHFADPRDPRIEEYERNTSETVYSPEILRVFAEAGYGGIEVEHRLSEIARPVLVLAGRHDRTCVPEGAQAIADGIPGAQLVVFEDSAHMTFVEEQPLYVRIVRDFLDRTT